MSHKLLCFTLFLLLITTSLCQNAYIDFIYDVSRFINPAPQLDPKLADFAKGFLEGIGSASNFDELKSCLVDSASIYTDIDTGFQDILTKKIAKVRRGIALLGQAAQAIPEAAQDCELADAEIAKLIKAVETFKNPAAFLYYVGKSLLINHVDVLKEVDSAIDAYQAQNETGIGYWIGKAMDTILLNEKTVEAPRDAKSDLLDFAKGFLVGISNASVFDDIKACIADSEDIYTDIDDGIADIKTKVPDEVEKGIALLGQAADLVPNAVQLCKASEVDMDRLFKLIESFKSPESFLYYVGKSLIINHVDVIHEVENAVNGYIAKNYTDLGYWVGKAMDTILLGQKTVAISPKDTKADVLDFVKGFLTGVGNASIFDNITECVTISEQFTTEVDQGIDDIKTKKPEKVKQGIALLGQAAQLVPDAVQICKIADANLDALIQKVESFKSPKAFFYYVGKSLMINHVEVIKEVSQAVNGYEAQNYTDLGYWVGRAMDTIFINQNATLRDTKDDVLNFTLGFLEGIGSAAAFDDIKACIADADEFATDIDDGFKDIKTKDPAKVKQGIILLGQAAQVVPNAVQLCRASDVDLDNLLKEVESFKSPEAFFYYVGKSLLINHVEVITEVKSAVRGYQAGNFTDIGYWVGKAMDSIIFGDKQTLTQDFVDHLNEVSGWKAKLAPKFEGMTLSEIKSRFLGVKRIDYSQFDNITEFDYTGLKDIPTYFNSSEQWPGCVHPIRDQGQCGSCWAFAASESLSDRFCVASNGSVQVILSPQYLISCNNDDLGCGGGVPLFSWWFMTKNGLVTDDCLPYASYDGKNGVKCNDFTSCADGTDLKYYYAKKDSVVRYSNPESIQTSIIQYGPAEATMTVYKDFMSYSGGIYTHTSGEELGGHAIKIIGWGNENDTNYWIVANSWNTTWGEDGFFRIAFGQCGIDSGVVVGEADLDRLSQSKPRFRFW